MSETYHLLCVDCKEYLWIGQGGYDMRNLYSVTEHSEALKMFLNNHKYHQLRFSGEDVVFDLDDCFEVVLNKDRTELVEEDPELKEQYNEEEKIRKRRNFHRFKQEEDPTEEPLMTTEEFFEELKNRVKEE